MAVDRAAMIIRVAANLQELRANLAEGKNLIEVTTQAMGKLAASFDGSKITQQAMNVVAAVNQIGGATKLTEAEQARVNATLQKALEKYAALGREAPPGMRELEQATRKVAVETEQATQKTQTWGQTFTATLAGFVTAQAVIGATRAVWRNLTDFVSSSVESYLAAEAAQSKLTAALRAAGQAAPATIQQYNELATTFQKTTVFSDDLINEMQALLVQVGGVMPSQMEGALKAATNLASGLGIDLRQATMLVGKAFEGETGTLKRYGIVIDEAKLKAGGMPVVLDAINSRFGGQAQAAIETTAGKLKQLANEWDNVKEAIGGAIVNDPLVIALLTNMTAGATAAADASAKLSAANTDGERADIQATEALKQFNLENDDFFTKAVLQGIPGLRALRMEIDNLRLGYSEAALEASALAKAVASIPKATGLPKPADLPKPPPLPKELLDGTWERQQKAVNKATTDGASAAAAYAKSVQSLADTWTNASINRELDKLSAALKNAAASGQLNEAGVQKLIAAYGPLRQLLGPNALPKDLEAVFQAGQKVITSTESMAVAALRYGNVALPPAIDRTTALRNQLEGLTANGLIPTTRSFADLFDKMGEAPTRTEGVTFGADAIREAMITGKEAADDYGQAFSTATQFVGLFGDQLGELGQILGGGISALDQYFGAMGQANDAVDKAADAMAKAKTAAEKLAAAQQASAAEADKVAATQQLVTSGMMIYFSFIMSQMAAQDAARAQGLAFAEQLSEVNDRLREQYGSFAQAQAAAERYGLALADVRTKYMTITAAGTSRTGPSGPSDSREVDRFNDQVKSLEEMTRRAADAAKELGLSWTDMPDIADRLQAATLASRELLTMIAALTGAGYDFNAVIAAMGDDINAWLSQVLDAGVGIPAAMQAVIDAFIRTGELTDANAMKLLGYVGDAVPSIDEMRAAAEKYGISWEEVEKILARVAEATKKAADKSIIDEMADLLKGSGFKSMAELEAIAGQAGRVYAEMVRAGGYSAAVMQQAFEAWQKALAAINPALDAATTGVDRAAAAGYQTKAALEAAAKAAGDLYAEMLASGLYTTDTLKRAWDAWQDALGNSGAGGMSKAIREELAGLKTYIESELPEFDELGNRIFGVDEARALERIKEIEREAKAAVEQTGAAGVTLTAKVGEATFVALTSGQLAAKNAGRQMKDLGTDGTAAFALVRDAATEAEAKIKNCWDRGGELEELLGDADFGRPFRDWKSDVDDLLDSLSRLPGGGGPTGGSRSYTDYSTGSSFNQAVARSFAFSGSSGPSGGSPYPTQSSASSSSAPMQQTIIVQLNDEVIGRAAARSVPGQVRVMTR